MRSAIFVMLSLAAGTIVLSAARGASTPPRSDAAWRAFWDADSTGAADKAAQAIVATGATPAAVHDRLAAGRPYSKQRTGRIDIGSRAGGVALDNVVEVP